MCARWQASPNRPPCMATCRLTIPLFPDLHNLSCYQTFCCYLLHLQVPVQQRLHRQMCARWHYQTTLNRPPCMATS
jgi:hypothetical protein